MATHTNPAATDNQLVRAIRHGRSDDAFRVLYHRHTPRALQVAWRILGGLDREAEDVVQEAWTRAISALDEWRGDAPFGAWFRGIIAHIAVDAVRRRAHFPSGTDDGVDECVDDLAARELPLGDRLDLEAAIAALAPGYRAVLVLHDIEGFTHEEIARQLGITAGTSKGQLFKARRAVRARLEPEPKGGGNGGAEVGNAEAGRLDGR
jgi:RNA polymerase sigma-70 factor (ECF subfamily)